MTIFRPRDLTYHQIDNTSHSAPNGGPKIDRFTVTLACAGAITGESRQSLMIFYHDSAREGRGSGEWVGLDLITGRVGDRSGSLAIRQRGSLSDAAQVTWEGICEVVPDSGTGGLAGLRGQGAVTINRELASTVYRIDFVFS